MSNLFDKLKSEAAVLDGLEIADKAELIGVPLIITSVRLQTGARDIEYAYVEAVTESGDSITFNDSSSGIKAQLIDYLEALGKTITEGEIFDGLKLLIPRGLRVSEFDAQIGGGKTRRARTFYLTTSGKSAGETQPKPAAKRAAPKPRA